MQHRIAGPDRAFGYGRIASGTHDVGRGFETKRFGKRQELCDAMGIGLGGNRNVMGVPLPPRASLALARNEANAVPPAHHGKQTCGHHDAQEKSHEPQTPGHKSHEEQHHRRG